MVHKFAFQKGVIERFRLHFQTSRQKFLEVLGAQNSFTKPNPYINLTCSQLRITTIRIRNTVDDENHFDQNLTSYPQF